MKAPLEYIYIGPALVLDGENFNQVGPVIIEFEPFFHVLGDFLISMVQCPSRAP